MKIFGKFSRKDELKKKVLVVDDNKSMIFILKFIFNKKGYEVVIAEDGEEGLSKYKEIKPELVILDLMMPRMNGLECLSHIKEFNKDAKVVMCSSLIDGDKINEAIELGAFDYITKPFTEEQITKILNKLE